MDKFTSAIEKLLTPMSTWVSNNKSLQAISKGFMSILPVTIISSLFYLAANFPITAWTEWLTSSGIQQYILIPYNVTMGLFSLYAVFAISYHYANAEKCDAISSGILALINFFCLTPYVTDIEGVLFAQGGYAYSFDWLGCKGLFVSMIVAVITAKGFCLFEKKGWTIHMPEGVPPYVEKIICFFNSWDNYGIYLHDHCGIIRKNKFWFNSSVNLYIFTDTINDYWRIIARIFVLSSSYSASLVVWYSWFQCCCRNYYANIPEY